MAFERAAGAPQGATPAPGSGAWNEPAGFVVAFTSTTGKFRKWACFLLL